MCRRKPGHCLRTGKIRHLSQRDDTIAKFIEAVFTATPANMNDRLANESANLTLRKAHSRNSVEVGGILGNRVDLRVLARPLTAVGVACGHARLIGVELALKPLRCCETRTILHQPTVRIRA